MDLGLSGRTALVTGATGGIGREVARAFVAEGATVALGYRNDREGAERLARELKDAFAVRYALDDADSAAEAVAAVRERRGGTDVFVANAFSWGRRRAPGTRFEDVAPDEWGPVVGHNLAPVVRATQLVLPQMRERGWGRIAFVSSHNAFDGQRGQEFYGTVKAGLYGLARSLAWDVGQDGVLVNVVAPGLTLTERVRTGLPEEIRERERSRTPTGRLSTPQEVARTLLFLCSAANGNVTGENVTVAGGR
ncbi:SDR family NAD(P)-dependent oxidoreductase [Streptomyces sp. NPDC050560]|uniref:SDR family NAD(P)-dependent oxidoreductase n=1 Tax=Streptomyces sp. NPDC050560 TaxID=3365630 RepID=UPI0037BB3B74